MWFLCSEECICACRHSWKVFRQVSHSSVRVKYGAVYSCCGGLRESDQKGFGLAAQQRLLFPRGCAALPCASALTGRSIAMPIQSGGSPRAAAELLFVTFLSPPMPLALSSCACCGFWFGGVVFVAFFFFSSPFRNYSLLFKCFQEGKENVY